MNHLPKDARIYVAGHRGLLGTALLKTLRKQGYENLLYKTSSELDLTNQEDTYAFLKSEKPDVVILAAGKVGGIHANRTYPADFMSTNMIIEHNVIWGSFLAGIPKLVFTNSSCAYPRDVPQPMTESQLLSSYPETTNQYYAVAKIAGTLLVNSLREQHGMDYFSTMICSMYGPRDNYDLNNSHVIPALLRKFHESMPNKPVLLWGTGVAKREFLHSEDAADGILFLLNNPHPYNYINLGSGVSISIKELASKIQKTVGHKGDLLWDVTMPDGHPEKVLNTSKINQLGWSPKITLEEGLVTAYDYYRNEVDVKAKSA